jgi:ankyrin repeat protein
MKRKSIIIIVLLVLVGCQKLPPDLIVGKMDEKQLFNAIERGDSASVNLILSGNPKLVDSRYWPCGCDHGTAFHHAAEKGDPDIVKMLLQHGADIDALYDGGRAKPINNAVYNGHFEVVKILVQEGADLKFSKDSGADPVLHSAAYSGNAEIIEYLIKHGCDVNEKGIFRDSALHVAAEHGKYHAAQILLKNGANVNAKNDIFETPLSLAIRETYSYNLHEMRKLLLDNSAGHNIFTAAATGRLDEVKRLLNQNPEWINAEDTHMIHTSIEVNDGESISISFMTNSFAKIDPKKEAEESVRNYPEQFRIKNKDIESVKIVIKVTSEDHGNSPIHYAARKGHLDVVKYLVSKGADINADGENGTPFFQAIKNGRLDVAELLIQKGSDINKGSPLDWVASKKRNDPGKDKFEKSEGWTVYRGNDWSPSGWDERYKLAEFLLENGADVNQKDDGGMTPLEIAACFGNVSLVELFILNGADVNANGDGGRSVLYYAADRGHQDCVMFLISKGSEVNMEDNWGRTPLYMAAGSGHADVVQTLIDAGATINNKNSSEGKVKFDEMVESGSFSGHAEFGTTALHEASTWGHAEVVKILLENGANVNEPDDYGEAPLHKAADRSTATDHREVIKLLLKHGADKNARNKKGLTAKDLARAKGRNEVVRQLSGQK